MYLLGCMWICCVIKYLCHTRHHTSKFITTSCLVSQQMHKAYHTSRAYVLSSTTCGTPDMHDMKSPLQAQLQHNYCNIKKTLCIASCQDSSSQAHNFGMIAGTSEYTRLPCMYVYRIDHMQLLYIKIFNIY